MPSARVATTAAAGVSAAAPTRVRPAARSAHVPAAAAMRTAIARRRAASAVAWARIAAIRRTPHDRLMHIQLRTRVSSLRSAAVRRTISARQRTRHRRAIPVAAAAAPLAVGRCARFVVRRRRKRPESITARRRASAHAAVHSTHRAGRARGTSGVARRRKRTNLGRRSRTAAAHRAVVTSTECSRARLASHRAARSR